MSGPFHCPRILEQHLEQIDLEAEIAKQRKRDRRFPVIWARVGTGYRVEHVRPEHYVKIVDLINKSYLTNEVLCKSLSLFRNGKSVESFLDRVLYTLKDNASIVLLDESQNDKIVGTLLLRVVHKLDFGRVFSRVAFDNDFKTKSCMTVASYGPAHRKIVQLQNDLLRQTDLFDSYDCTNFIRYYLLCIDNRYRGKHLGLQLMRVGLLLGGYLRIPIATGIFTGLSSQVAAKKLGFETVREITYSEYVSSDKQVPVIKNPGPLNRTCALMVAKIPPPYIANVNKEITKAQVEKTKKKSKKDKKGKKKGKK